MIGGYVEVANNSTVSAGNEKTFSYDFPSDFKDEWRGVFNDFISAAKWYREQLKQRQ